ncbi:hypothetical protein B0T22DRAFT_477121 [Podospora appendiculata]|uniref:RNA ligase domain-containing protein n=1 Tax=Podospora appendiculata TaxID=314037 RepID=A0AAE0XJ39_9PEZI|nr:hypothetical protein B0T22DRAFT_477121 [Podospora appendiculata]
MSATGNSRAPASFTPIASMLSDKENAPAPAPAPAKAAAGSRKRKSTDEQALAAAGINLDDIDVEHMPITENCDQVRRKINRFIDSGAMSKTAFAREIGVSVKLLSGFLGEHGPDKGAGYASVENAHQEAQARRGSYHYLHCRERDNSSRSGVTQAQLCRGILAQLKLEDKPARIQGSQLARFRGKKGANAGATSAVLYGACVFFEKLRIKAKKPKSKTRLEMEKVWGLRDSTGRLMVEPRPAPSTPDTAAHQEYLQMMFEALDMSPQSLTSSSDPFESDGQSIRLETPALPLKTDDRLLESTVQSLFETSRQPPAIAPQLFDRSLVTVQRITRIKRIKNPDKKTQKRAILSLDGWTVIAHNRDVKTRFKPNDLVVLIEADSFLPISGSLGNLVGSPNARIETINDQKGYRVTPPVIGNHISDGLVYRLDEIPEIHEPYQARVLEIGGAEATTELLSTSFDSALGVHRWEFAPEMGLAMGPGPDAPTPRPSWQRGQDRPSIFKPAHRKARETTWQITEKLDGELMHVYKVASERYFDYIFTTSSVFLPATTTGRREHVGICNRTYEYADDGRNHYNHVARESAILDKIRRIPYPNLDVQGELVGHTPDDDEMDDALRQVSYKFFVFGIWDIDLSSMFSRMLRDGRVVQDRDMVDSQLPADLFCLARLEGFAVISGTWLEDRERYQ